MLTSGNGLSRKQSPKNGAWTPVGGEMSVNRKLLNQFPKSAPIFSTRKDPKTYLTEILNFGPIGHPASQEVTERIKQLVKELEEINRRIDELSNRM